MNRAVPLPRRPRSLLLALLLAAAPSLALAQVSPLPPKPRLPQPGAPEPTVPDPRPPRPPRDSLWEYRSPGPTFPYVFGYREGGPLHHSVYAGWSWLRPRSPGPYGSRSGPKVVAEAGVGGGQAGVGWATYGPHLGAAHFQATVMRTWGDPREVEPGENYLGLEARFGLSFVGLGLVAYQPLGGPADPDRFIGALTLVIGF